MMTWKQAQLVRIHFTSDLRCCIQSRSQKQTSSMVFDCCSGVLLLFGLRKKEETIEELLYNRVGLKMIRTLQHLIPGGLVPKRFAR